MIYAKIHEHEEEPNFEDIARELIKACKADLNKRMQYTNTWRQMDMALGRNDVQD